MTDTAAAAVPRVFPSVDDWAPNEHGGPIARNGFNYQDEVAVGFFLEMLADPHLIKVHCETHDDILLVREMDGVRTAEFVQVKGGEIDTLWSVAILCRRERSQDGPKIGSSLFETSLARDAHREEALFRIVTLRDVGNDLRVLTWPRHSPGRELDGHVMATLMGEIDNRCGGAASAKENGCDYWLERCHWDVRNSQRQIELANRMALVSLAQRDGFGILLEQADVLLEEQRARVKIAGAARWAPDRDLKIVTRVDLWDWWNRRLAALIEGAKAHGGGKLADKLREVGADEASVKLAVEIRRDYAAAIRTSRYMSDDDAQRLQSRVKAELMSLRMQFSAGEFNTDGIGFLALCIRRLNELNNERPPNSEDRGAFLQGCLYDIADRCLHKFARP